MRDRRADSNHLTRGLMPKNHWRVHDKGADLAMGIVMHIRPADTDGIDGDLHILRANFGRQVDVTDIQNAFAFQHQRLHATPPGSRMTLSELRPSAAMSIPSRKRDRGRLWVRISSIGRRPSAIMRMAWG